MSEQMDYFKDFTEQMTNTSLGELHSLRHRGTGPKLLLLHGLGGNTKVWNRFVGFLPDDYDVAILDLLGHGGSAAPEIDYETGTQAKVLAEFIESIQYEDAFIMGHSYGGWVSAYYSMDHSPKGLILEDSAGLKDQFDEIRATANEMEYRENMISELLRINNNKEYVMRSIAGMNMERNHLTHEMLGRIRVPTLIIWGAQDRTIGRKFAEVFRENIRGSELKVVEGAGHNGHFSRAKDVAGAVIAFVSTHVHANH